MKPRNVVNTFRPMQGLGAFARAAAAKPHGTCRATLSSSVPAGYCALDRAENQLYPGEGDA